MATIRKRGKRWEAQVRNSGVTVCKSHRTRVDAEAWAHVIESELVRGVYRDRSEAERTTLGELLSRYQREVTPHKKGAAQESRRIDAMKNDPIAKIRVAALSGTGLAGFRDRRLQTVSGSTANRDLSLLRHLFSVARRDWGIVNENPVADVRRPRENRARDRRLVGDEESRLLAALSSTERDARGRLTGPQNIWVRPMVELAIATAMRRGELLALRWPDIDFDACFANLRDTKNGDRRCVPLSPAALKILRGLPRDIRDPRVFPTTADAVQKFFERARARAGMPDFRFHDLRHEAITRLAEYFPNSLHLSAVSGHRSLQMLKRYYNPNPSDLARALGSAPRAREK